MRLAAYATIAYAIKQRDAAARNQARQKVHQLAGDIAAILAHEDPAFNSTDFYSACGFTGDDVAAIGGQTREVAYGMLARSSADPGENETHQGYKNYETFVVCNWLDNDQELLYESAQRAREAAESGEIPDAAAATALREWIEAEKLTEDRETEVWDVLDGPAGSLLNAALGEVDWLEVAQTRLAFAAEQDQAQDED